MITRRSLMKERIGKLKRLCVHEWIGGALSELSAVRKLSKSELIGDGREHHSVVRHFLEADFWEETI